ncbi:RidA family protein [Hwanghaeella grinnelliae]|uniref:RidA family protein n=1 Tax=Hwanghaeella grinnelliae TaxID=2500179 RepID=A0A3S2WC41_9PROT|nr:RidA family protein [Hwanghaeella grinnelliae]RVU39029.1 RidA family protein [Hwanghaeella grinnelliae]
MDTAIINPPALYDPAPNGYSHAVKVDSQATLVFISGQGGELLDGSLPEGFEAQVKQAYRNLLAVIEAAGGAPGDVIKLTTYPVGYDESKLATMTRTLMAAFGDHLPAQTLVPVHRLALEDMLFEVEAVLALPA